MALVKKTYTNDDFHHMEQLIEQLIKRVEKIETSLRAPSDLPKQIGSLKERLDKARIP